MTQGNGNTAMAPPSLDGNGLPVNATLRRIVVIFRLLGWAWMLAAVIVTLIYDDEVNAGIAIGAAALATMWTALTLWAARSHERLTNLVFVGVDLAITLAILSASEVAGADHFFHGGYPMSWIIVAAYAWGFRGVAYGSLTLVAEQIVVDIVSGRAEVSVVGAVTFLVFGIVVGWAFSALRDGERRRLETVAQLAEEQEKLAAEQRQRARFEERVELANRLHDSVLQTLIVLRRDSDDSRQVRYLARRQERQLRQTINEFRSPYHNSVRAALLRHTAEIEDMYKVEVEAVVRGDAEMSDRLEAVAGAAREALSNAAKHSGELGIDLYAELSDRRVEVFIRDRGRGFDPGGRGGGGLQHSLVRRVESAGGRVEINSAPGKGTEIAIRVDEHG
jgi:signal transduction histidine kinase